LKSEPASLFPSTKDASVLERRLFLALGAIALVYAFLAGLRTVSDPDLGWQLATGRWVAQHHHVFSTDVFSYTACGGTVGLPGWLRTGALCHLLARRIRVAFMGWGSSVPGNGGIAAPAWLGLQRGHCDSRDAAHRGAHRSAR
jgi:hypothetical protein